VTRYMLVIASVMWAGLSFGAVKYKCDGEWVDYWPCDKELVDNKLAIQAMKDEFAASDSAPITGNVESQLKSYGYSVAVSTHGAVNFTSVKKTTEKPLRAYVVVFKTSAMELMSNPNARANNSAFLENQFKTELWQRKLCTPELKSIMTNNGVDLVSGDLQDEFGETQSFALCH